MKQKQRTNKQADEIVSVGLDIGTSKVCCVVVSFDKVQRATNILGVGVAERKKYKGRHGRIDNIDQTVQDINVAVQSATMQSNIPIQRVNVGITGDSVKFYESRGLVSITSPNRVITKNDVARVLNEAKQIDIPPDYEILHTIPQEFIINNNKTGIINPDGMSGNKLEVLAKVVTAQTTEITNINHCLAQNGLEIGHIVLEPLATSLAILQEDELELGVGIIDIGENTTDVSVFYEGVMRYSNSFPIAGRQVTDDLRTLMNVVYSQAEEVKQTYGHCYFQSLRDDRRIMIPSTKGRRPLTFELNQICQFIQPRMEEIFEFAKEQLRKSNYSHRLGAGVVLTGGSVMLEGSEELATDVLGMPVRIGTPSDLNYKGLVQEVNKPYFSTAVGLALYGIQEEKSEYTTKNGSIETRKEKQNVVYKIVELFKKL